MIKKTFGIIMSILGLIGVAAYSVPGVKQTIPYISQVPDFPLLIVSLGVLITGLFMVVRSGEKLHKQPREVPIYHGKHIVGYRRH